jgi:asparagine synthase (glutamine-hydrolysing)
VSGICGLLDLSGAPVEEAEVRSMTSLLERRGPDATGIWSEGAIGLGHTLLATTAESRTEPLPLRHAATGCVITGDVRLDNRQELIRELRPSRTHRVGDAELVVLAYLRWGERCVEHLLGDFAYALWDPRSRKLVCARDPVGIRPFYYCHVAGRFFAFASEAPAILVVPRTPYAINEARIADFLVLHLEGLDETSTFFRDVHRLPPAHVLSVTERHLSRRQYWALEPGDPLRLRNDGEYADAFLETFTEAVRARLRGDPPVGSMLSGGMDSASIAAVASALRGDGDRAQPLSTFSAVSRTGEGRQETEAIQQVMHLDGFRPQTVAAEELPDLDGFRDQTWSVDEPFDGSMTMVRAVYHLAHAQGVKALLDGASGDTVLDEGEHLSHLLARGRWLTAYREAAAQNVFWEGAYPPVKEIARRSLDLLVPESLLSLRRRWRADRLVDAEIRTKFIAPQFAREIDLAGRLSQHAAQVRTDRTLSPRHQRVESIRHPYLTVGRERYDRTAAAYGIEPRDPFTDLRLLDLIVRLPGEQLLQAGWPKAILRRALAPHLPATFRYRTGKPHLGWQFTRSFIRTDPTPLATRIGRHEQLLEPYVDLPKAGRATGSAAELGLLYDAAHLAEWLARFRVRPLRDAGPTGSRATMGERHDEVI